MVVRPLQQELASLEVSSDYHLNLEENTQDLRRNWIKSQVKYHESGHLTVNLKFFNQ